MFRRLIHTVCLTLAGALLLTAFSSHAATLLSQKHIAYCKSVGALAEGIARAHDAGVPLTELLAKKTASQDSLIQSIHIDIYEHSWWTPAYARQQWEVPCIQVRLQAAKD